LSAILPIFSLLYHCIALIASHPDLLILRVIMSLFLPCDGMGAHLGEFDLTIRHILIGKESPNWGMEVFSRPDQL
jgi:hypothetical protein